MGNLGGTFLFKYFKNLFIPENFKEEEIQEEKHEINTSIEESIKYFKNEFNNSSDLVTRKIKIEETPTVLISVDGMINKDILANSVINPIRAVNFEEKKFKNSQEKYEFIRDNVLSTADQIEAKTYEEAISLGMAGFLLLQIEGSDKILAIGIQGYNFRGISEPTNEVMQRGSKEGFVEPLRINITLIRRRIKNTNLKFETMKIGTVSKTDICLCYMCDTVSEKILEEIKKRIKKANLKTVLAAGYLSPYLEESKSISLFTTIGISERPDTICGKISEGRVAILIDGAPNALIIPHLFIENFQNLDDYAFRPYFATLTRWLKYFSFLIAVLLPGIYVATGTFNPELLASELIIKIAKSVATTPLSLMFEALIIHLIYEIMREAGLRLPTALGHAVSIVGALVIGQTAVDSGLVSGPTLMIVALTALASYVIPHLYEPVAILRLIFIIIGGTLGIWGVMLFFSIVIMDICSKTNFGIPFSAPISPFNFFGMRDVLVRAGWKTLSKKVNKVQEMPGTRICEENV